MGKLCTLEGFTLKDMLDKLMIPAGFVMDLRIWDNTILLSIEDLRARPDFKGDRAADKLPEFLDKIAELGLDAGKAIVSLGCRKERLGSDSLETFNVGIVQLGWVISAPAAPKCPIPKGESAASHSRPRQPPITRSTSFS